MKTRLVVVFGLLVLLFTGLLIGGCSEAQSPHYFKRTLSENWLVQSADSVTADGSAISVAGFNGNNWYRATVPSTVLHALVSNGVYKNIFLDDNLNKISDKPFKSSWWYRTSFTLD
jgi:exo-1,4-beta-D-glucosaminidase